MVVIPGGTFMMGSPADEEHRSSSEGPQHRVTIAPFAMGKTEVTFAQWDACMAAGECNGYKPRDQGWGRESRPVINVSWHDAEAYVGWLSKQTGKPYRLPTEAEWEYAARAATTTSYAFGDAITRKNANCGGENGKTAEVGSYQPNSWGLYDMHGNVEEWVEDVWHNSYQGAPTNGAAWTDGKPLARVLRGGGWFYFLSDCRSAIRNSHEPDAGSLNYGFRLARTLD
jgi:formylglycine-generating enzyme required for sulfatase activity